jgi:hypothetical protein
MREIDKYGVLKEKLQGICDENSLTYSIQNQKYPFLMIIKPLGGVDAQQTMLEGMEEATGTGYISPDASLVFAYRDGDLSYKISETWTISENLFNKLKNLFKKMHSLWMQYFFRDVYEHSPGVIPLHDDPTAPQDEEPCEEEDEDTSDAFAEFMDEAEAQLYNDGGAGEDDEE